MATYALCCRFDAETPEQYLKKIYKNRKYFLLSIFHEQINKNHNIWLQWVNVEKPYMFFLQMYQYWFMLVSQLNDLHHVSHVKCKKNYIYIYITLCSFSFSVLCHLKFVCVYAFFRILFWIRKKTKNAGTSAVQLTLSHESECCCDAAALSQTPILDWPPPLHANCNFQLNLGQNHRRREKKGKKIIHI